MWYIALSLGFLGSLHCVGMCSPLAMAAVSMKGSVFGNRILYNTGRIFTYSLLGAIVSVAGSLFPIPDFQNFLSIVLGAILLVVAVTGIKNIRIPVITSSLTKFTSILKSAFATFLAKKTRLSMLVLGALNGLLPCGLTVLALAYCLTLKSPWEGFAFMLMFGAGTLPAMIGLTWLLNAVVQKFQWSIRKVTTVLLIVSAGLLIARVFVGHTMPHSSHEVGSDDIVICR